MTRAIDRLIVAGSVDPSRRDAARSPIGWVIERLGADLGAESSRGARARRQQGARPCRSRDAGAPRSRRPPSSCRSSPGSPRQPERRLRAGSAAAVAVPPADPTGRRLSYSALALYSSAARTASTPSAWSVSRPAEAPSVVGEAEGLAATEIGDAVHALLEADPGPAGGGRGHGGRRGVSAFLSGRYALVGPEDAERVAALVAAWRASPLAARLARALRGPRRSCRSPSSTTACCCTAASTSSGREGREALVVDYKTNRLEGADARRIVGPRLPASSVSSMRWRRSARVSRPSRSSSSSSSGRTTWSRRASRADDLRGSRPSFPRLSRRSRPASSARRRASSPARDVRRSTGCVRARRLGSGADAVPIDPELAATTPV